MITGRWKLFLNLFGGLIILFWLVMIGTLIKKTTSIEVSGDDVLDIGSMVIETGKREWKDIFLKGKKVGYSINLIKPFDDGYFIQDEIFLKINLMGMGRGLYAITQSMVDKQFFLKSFYFKMSSGIVNSIISGKVDGDQIFIHTGKGKDRRMRRIQLAEPPMISTGMGYLFRTMKISVGDSFRLPFFDPSTMVQKSAVLKVTGKEHLKINRVDYDAFRVETEMWGKPMAFWIDKSGTILKEETFMGLMMIKSSAANAPMNIDGTGGEDFYEMAAVPVDKQLPKVAKLNYLKLKLKGAADTEALRFDWNSGRQKFSHDIMEIKLEKQPFKITYAVPYEGSDHDLSRFLMPEFNIESDAEEIIEKARDIRGDNRNPVFVSRRLLYWVYENIDKKPVVSIPSALEVLRSRVGDCNEHATLLAALLRASGIPARLSIGLVYSRNKFFYHAWTEAFVGEWVTMDATLNQMPTDVSHIRLMHGNLDKQVEIMGFIGKLQCEVLDFGYD